MPARKITDTVQLKLRIREDLRRRLEREAKKRSVSLNAEMADRIEQSFDQEDLVNKMLGGEHTAIFLKVLGLMIQAVEHRKGHRWNEDHDTLEQMLIALLSYLESFGPSAEEMRAIARSNPDKTGLQAALVAAKLGGQSETEVLKRWEQAAKRRLRRERGPGVAFLLDDPKED